MVIMAMDKRAESKQKGGNNVVSTGLDLKVMRIRAGLRQYQVAGALGYGPTWLANIENGFVGVTPDLAERISDAIDSLTAVPA